MVKITKPGVSPVPPRDFVGRCPVCGCEVEVKEYALDQIWDRVNRVYVAFLIADCPMTYPTRSKAEDKCGGRIHLVEREAPGGDSGD